MGTHEKEARRLIELLGRMVKLSGRSQRALEAELGLGSSVLGKILNGSIRPQLAYVLMISEAIGISPGEFFRLAYPKQGIKSPMAKEILAAEGIDVDEGTAPAADDLDDRVRDALIRVVDELRRKP